MRLGLTTKQGQWFFRNQSKSCFSVCLPLAWLWNPLCSFFGWRPALAVQNHPAGFLVGSLLPDQIETERFAIFLIVLCFGCFEIRFWISVFFENCFVKTSFGKRCTLTSGMLLVRSFPAQRKLGTHTFSPP